MLAQPRSTARIGLAGHAGTGHRTRSGAGRVGPDGRGGPPPVLTKVPGIILFVVPRAALPTPFGSAVSRLGGALDEHVKAVWTRPLAGRYPDLLLEAGSRSA